MANFYVYEVRIDLLSRRSQGGNLVTEFGSNLLDALLHNIYILCDRIYSRIAAQERLLPLPQFFSQSSVAQQRSLVLTMRSPSRSPRLIADRQRIYRELIVRSPLFRETGGRSVRYLILEYSKIKTHVFLSPEIGRSVGARKQSWTNDRLGGR